MTNKDILKQWHTSVWEDGDMSAVSELMIEDHTAKVLLPDARLTPVDVETFAELILTLVTDLRGDFLVMLDDGEWVSALLQVTATATQSGQEFTFASSLFAKIIDGKITEVYSQFDQFHVFEALGALPEDTMSMCLMGETLS